MTSTAYPECGPEPAMDDPCLAGWIPANPITYPEFPEDKCVEKAGAAGGGGGSGDSGSGKI